MRYDKTNSSGPFSSDIGNFMEECNLTMYSIDYLEQHLLLKKCEIMICTAYPFRNLQGTLTH
jgi:hypothetical protein